MNHFLKENVCDHKREKVRWGIIGLGYMAHIFCDVINDSEKGYVYAVASRTVKKASKFAQEHGVAVFYGTYEELISDNNVDVVYIATPLDCHYDNIERCLLKQKNVLCEKPIVNSSYEYNVLLKLAEKQKCLLLEGMWSYYLPTYKKAKEWIEAGLIGDVELIRIDFYKNFHYDPSIQKHGVMRDYGIYALAFLNYFISGECQTKSVYCRKNSDDLDTDWAINGECMSGKVSYVINISSCFKSKSKAVIIGKKGTIEFESQFNRTNIITLLDIDGNCLKKTDYEYKKEGFEYEVSEVNKVVLEKSSCKDMQKRTLSTLKLLDDVTEKMSRECR